MLVRTTASSWSAMPRIPQQPHDSVARGGSAPHDPRRESTRAEWTEEAREEALARAPEFGRRFFDEVFARFPAVAGAVTFLRWSTQPDDVYAVVDLSDRGFTVQVDPTLEYVIVWTAATHAEFGDWDGDQVEPALALVAEILGDEGAGGQEA
jgi:hypothetical protein